MLIKLHYGKSHKLGILPFYDSYNFSNLQFITRGCRMIVDYANEGF